MDDMWGNVERLTGVTNPKAAEMAEERCVWDECGNKNQCQ